MLRDKIASDNNRVFMNVEHFADTHNWNGVNFVCVVDEEGILKRKNNNVVDISWGENNGEALIYVPVKDFPGRAVVNEHGFFDNKPVKINSVNTDMGMYTIHVSFVDPKQIL